MKVQLFFYSQLNQVELGRSLEELLQLDSLAIQICASDEERAKLVQDKEMLSKKVLGIQSEPMAMSDQINMINATKMEKVYNT